MSSSITAILHPLLRKRGVKAALAKQLGVSPSTIGRWEEGVVTLPERDREAAEALAKALE